MHNHRLSLQKVQVDICKGGAVHCIGVQQADHHLTCQLQLLATQEVGQDLHSIGRTAQCRCACSRLAQDILRPFLVSLLDICQVLIHAWLLTMQSGLGRGPVKGKAVGQHIGEDAPHTLSIMPYEVHWLGPPLFAV